MAEKKMTDWHRKVLCNFDNAWSATQDMRKQIIEAQRFVRVSGAQWEGSTNAGYSFDEGRFEHYPAGLTTGFPCHFQRFHGEPAVRRERHGPAHWFSCEQVENNGEVRPALTRPDIGHITAPHLIWLGHGELPFKVVRDSNMFMTTTFIPVSRLLTADQPQLFHEPASKPASHLVASPV